jgi:hypothetical protein
MVKHNYTWEDLSCPPADLHDRLRMLWEIFAHDQSFAAFLKSSPVRKERKSMAGSAALQDDSVAGVSSLPGLHTDVGNPIGDLTEVDHSSQDEGLCIRCFPRAVHPLSCTQMSNTACSAANATRWAS